MLKSSALNRIPPLFLLLFFMIVNFTGCTPEPGAGRNFEMPPCPPLQVKPGDLCTVQLYYPDGQWRFLVPLHREVQETDTIVRHTLEKMVDTPQLREELEPVGLVPLLPGETAIHGIHISEGEPARVDFSESFLGYTPSCERIVLGGLLCTLRQFPDIERLEIMIDGVNPVKFPGGTPGLVPLGPECLINLEVDDELEDYRNYTAVTVYFCFLTPREQILYVPVTRALPPADDAVAAAVEELLAGPRRGSGLFSDIPPGTILRGLQLDEGLITADFSKKLLCYEGGLTGAENMTAQILLTLASLEGAGEVQILVEGEKVKLPDGIDLTSALKPPPVYNFY